MALCTQNRCADQTALHLVSPPSAYRSTRSMKTRTELAHPFGHRNSPILCNQPLFFYKICLQQATPTLPPKSRIVKERSHFGFLFYSLSFLKIRLAPGYLSLGPKARLEVDSNH
ncbi:hypothetical protein AHAS_Ahas19G0207500 [Arachis hypogaea]